MIPLHRHKDNRPLITGVAVLLLLLIGMGLFFSSGTLRELLTTPELLRDRVEAFGAWAPITIIGYHILQVIFAPIPGQGIDIANGFLFGPFWGAVNSLVGIGLGTSLAIWLSRRFGRPFIKRLLGQSSLDAIDRYTGQRSLKFFFLLFLIPGLPDDLLAFSIGLTKIPIGRAILTAMLGRAPGIITAVLLGASGSRLSPLWFLVVAGGLVGIWWLVLRWLHRRQAARGLARRNNSL